jgi:multidrug efflux pump subunit AcrB
MEKEQQIKREFGLSSFSLNNNTSIFIVGIIILVFGLISYIGMSKELYPEIVLPTVYINTIYPGNSPVDIENLITRPIEKELKPIKGIKKISSTSAQDVSAIIVEFNEDVDIAEGLTDIKDAIDKAKRELPSDLDNDPVAAEIDFSEIPLLFINLSGDFEVSKLKEYAEYLEDKLEMIGDVSKVDITGALDREIQINVNPFKLEALKLNFGDIEQAIGQENLNVGGGDVLVKGYRRALRVTGEFTSVEQIQNIIIKSEKGKPIYLRDVAQVIDSYVERQSYARHAVADFAQKGTKPVVTLIVNKRSGGNIIDASIAIEEVLKKARKNYLPQNLSLSITNDQAENMKGEIANLENSIVSGVILVVVVLLFFLGLRNALLVGMAIPFSMFMSFIILSSLGITLNMIVLFSLILALGMLVDNAIVIIENIYRLREEGYSAMQAAKEGAGEVALPIIGSTLTTLAAFVPLAFWGGIMGEFMKYMPITLIIVLSSSLFVGLVLNPVLALMFMKLADQDDAPSKHVKALMMGVISIVLGGISYFIFDTYTIANLLVLLGIITIVNILVLSPFTKWFQTVFLVALENIYVKTLRFALTGWKPYAFLLGTFGMLIFSIMLLGWAAPKTVFFPANDPLYMFVNIEMALGTDTEKTNEISKDIEKEIFEVLAPYNKVVKSIIMNVGKGTSGDASQASGGSGGITPHRARMTIEFVKFQDRGGISTTDIMKELGEKVKSRSGIKITMEKNNDGPPTGKPISIELIGEDYTELLAEAERMKAYIDAAGIKGYELLALEAEIGKPELVLNIDREKARKYGLSTGMIGSTMRTALFGKEISKFKDGQDDYPIQLRMEDKFRYDESVLLNQKMTFRDNQGKWHQVPLSSVASFDYTSSYGFVKRKDLDKMVVISSNIAEGYNANEVVEDVKARLKTFELKDDSFTYKFGGEQEEQAKSMAFLIKALAIAISAIFLILVSQFNSASKPFMIVLSVVFSTIGVFLGLVIFEMDFVIIMTGIGIISLAGVVVNNAIVLIDYTELVRKRKKQELNLSDDEHLPIAEFLECLVQAGSVRLRPVLLTAITTVLGLIPLAVGFNIDFAGMFASFEPDIFIGGDSASMWGPMAWTVIFGLVFATFLTLIILPVMYLLIDKATQLITPHKKVTVIAEK